MLLPPQPQHPRARPGRALACAAIALALAGCAAGPDYVRPTLDIPAAYKEPGPWKSASPGSIDPHGEWWKAYRDPTLDRLIEQADAANQNIQQAQAQYRQAQATAAAARAGFWPTLGAGAGAQRAQTNTNGPKLGNTYSVGLSAAWEPDLWGGIRRSVQAGEAASQASAADLAAARLSIQAAVAQDYMQLRITDLQIDLYTRTIAAYQRALQLTQSQYASGVALRSDVALAQNQLSTTQAQALDLRAQRSQLEHALAILAGKAPANFSLAPAPSNPAQTLSLPLRLPETPTGVPSQLLERRPTSPPPSAAPPPPTPTSAWLAPPTSPLLRSVPRAATARTASYSGSTCPGASGPWAPPWPRPCSTAACARPAATRRSRPMTRPSPNTSRRF